MLRSLSHPAAAVPLSLVLTASLVLVQALPAWADALDDAGAEGQAFGEAILPTDPDDLSRTDPATGRITLLPGTADELQFSLDEVFPGASTTTIDDLKALHGDIAVTAERGRLEQQNLHGGVGDAATVEAYGVFLDTSERGQPDLAGDPVWELTEQVLRGIPGLTDSFGDCAVSTTVLPTSTTAHVPELRTCERIVAPPALCTIEHDYEFELLEVTGGTYSIDSCGMGCLDIWVGTVGNNYWRGRCRVYERSITLDILNPDAVTSATLNRVVYDDHHQVWLNTSLIWQSPWGFPPETGDRCERSTSHDDTLAVDVTSAFKTAGPVTFKNRTSVAGAGEGYSRIRLRYDPAKAFRKNDWGPADCLATARLIADGACTGTARTLAGPPPGTCITSGGLPLCPDQMPLPHPSLRAILPPLAERIRITSDCAITGGSMGCWVDPSGTLQCPTATPTVRDTCTPLASDPACAFVASRCVDGARLPNGTCLVAEDRYDCGYDVTIPSAETVRELACVGDVRCMGDDCFEPPSEASTGFAEAVAKLKAAQLTAMDADCSSGECEVFAGRAMECKKAVGGLVDCCDTPPGVSLSQYLSLLFAVQELDGSIRALDGAPLLRGAWETLSDPFVNTWDAVTTPFTTVLETVSGSTSAVSEAAAQGLLTGVRQALYHQTAEWTLAAFGEGAVTSLFQSVTAGEPLLVGGAINGSAEIALGGLVGTAVSWALTAYTVYALTTLIITLIWRCEREEFELGVNRELKQCRYIGSYCKAEFFGCFDKRESWCCFGSPLSRILQEQARPQLGIGWGDAENPDCRALTVAELSAIDWARVDLDEWLGILAAGGQIPDITSLDLATLTGEPRAVGQALPGTRPDALERSEARLDNLPGDTLDIKNDAAAELGTYTGSTVTTPTAPCRFEPATGAPVTAGNLAFAACRNFCTTTAASHPPGAQCRFGAAIIDLF